MKVFRPNLCFFAMIFAFACSKDDNVNISFGYDSTNFVTRFRSDGTTGAPAVNWKGNKGVFSLKNSIPGVSIDSNTGEVFWDQTLPPGINEITIEALNSKTIIAVTIEIESTLGDSFWNGGENSDPDSTDVPNNLQIWLYDDGTVQVEVPENEDANGVGTWEFVDNEIEIHLCRYCTDMNPLDVPSYNEHTLLRGTLTNTSLNAYFEGLEYVKYIDPDSESLRGYFYLEWD